MPKSKFTLVFTLPLFWLACAQPPANNSTDAIQGNADSAYRHLIGILPEIADPSIGIDSARKAIALAPKEELPRVYLMMGTHQKNNGQYDSALYYYEESFRMLPDNELGLKADYYRLAGVIYRIQGNLPEAFEFYKNAAHIYDTLSDTIELAKVYNSMGILFNGGLNSDYPKALEYFNQSAHLMEQLKDTAKLAFIKVNIAFAYKGLKQYDSSIHYLEQSIAYQKKTNNLTDLAVDLRVLSQTYMEMGNYHLAIEKGTEALKLSEQLNRLPEIIEAHLQLGHSYYAAGKYQESLGQVHNALNLSDQLPKSSNRLYCYSLLQFNYKKLNQPDSAYKYLEKYSVLRDSIQNDAKAQKIVEMELAFETERKDAQIKLLTAGQEIARQKLEKQRQFQIGLTILLITLLAFCVYVIYTNRQKHRLEEKILIDQMTTMKDLVWKLSREHTQTVEVGLESLNNKLVMPLTSREMEVLELVLSNHSNQEISVKLFISVNTVKFHLKNIFEKMAVTSRREAVDFVIESNNTNSTL